jgi:hypothetical protein
MDIKSYTPWLLNTVDLLIPDTDFKIKNICKAFLREHLILKGKIIIGSYKKCKAGWQNSSSGRASTKQVWGHEFKMRGALMSKNW